MSNKIRFAVDNFTGTEGKISDNFIGTGEKISDNFTGEKKMLIFAEKSDDKKFVSAFTSAFIEERIYNYYRRPSNREINID
jgi:hypothetical protein